jgi:hypothetical protein
MSEQSKAPGGRGPRSRGALAVIWTSAAVFLALLGVLSTRVASGQDPALRLRAAHAPAPVRRVLIRRVIERRVIIHLPPSAPAKLSTSSQQVSSAGTEGFSAPVTRAS